MYITDIKVPKGSRRQKKYLGRGSGSGHGKTSGRGHGGQGQRAGRDFRPGYEGGSMPLIRRIPKRGFRSHVKNDYQIININALNVFSKGATVTALSLKEEGLIKNGDGMVKLLGDGKLDKVLTIKVHKASKTAEKKILEAGATLQLI